VIDVPVTRERGHGRGDKPPEINRCHIVSSDARSPKFLPRWFGGSVRIIGRYR
jgi:hypothetical protein